MNSKCNFWTHRLPLLKASCRRLSSDISRAMVIKAKGWEEMTKNRKGMKSSSSEKAGKMVEGIWRNLGSHCDFRVPCLSMRHFFLWLVSPSLIRQKADRRKETRGKTFFTGFLIIPASCTSLLSTPRLPKPVWPLNVVYRQSVSDKFTVALLNHAAFRTLLRQHSFDTNP